MWLRAARNRFLIRGLAATLAALVCGGAIDWGHVGGDDPDCNLLPVAHDHSAHRFDTAPVTSPHNDHCYLCHSLRLLHVGLAARHERVAVDVRSTQHCKRSALIARSALSLDLSSRAPPAARS
jgi:hypothetical protein